MNQSEMIIFWALMKKAGERVEGGGYEIYIPASSLTVNPTTMVIQQLPPLPTEQGIRLRCYLNPVIQGVMVNDPSPLTKEEPTVYPSEPALEDPPKFVDEIV